jgi:hypothetical protein
MELSPSWEAINCAASEKLTRILCSLKVHSLLHSLDPSNGPYPEPDQTIPYHPILSLKDPSTSTSSYIMVFLVVSFLLAFPPITYMHSSSQSFMPHAPPSQPLWFNSNYTWRRVQTSLKLVKQLEFNSWKGNNVHRKRPEEAFTCHHFKVLLKKSLKCRNWLCSILFTPTTSNNYQMRIKTKS